LLLAGDVAAQVIELILLLLTAVAIYAWAVTDSPREWLSGPPDSG